MTNREQLEERRKRCEGLVESILIGLRKIKVDTTIEENDVGAFLVLQQLRFFEDTLRWIDEHTWAIVPDHLKNG